ncbi:sugar ABC transporter permease [Pelagibacterium luteolum]|uniref:Xylose transport system permease protein XylH n=1 Tax=Pelagibacterium luteolum TaxID=440168 RepID=A0A1G7ZLY5_9HYPH|nr:sugar ABC transporter permease [Pelagibacterium luteolum]SDH09752.1 D-xylose transport system permease protein [Pelagibacterium luteolum]
MAEENAISNSNSPTLVVGTPIRRFMSATELDTRLLGMVGALALIWIGFHFLSGGLFLTPRNLWNLSVQTASVSIMATGMVLVIVTRNIDLSVGSMLGFIAMLMGVMQAEILPGMLGFGHPAIWMLTLAYGLILGILIGGMQGVIIAYLKVPAFIVTLGGMLVWRGAAWWATSGRTVAPLDVNFRLLGGGPGGAVGYTISWLLAGVACIAIAVYLLYSRRQRRRFNFPQRPVWAEAILAALGFGVVIGAVLVFNAYPWPVRIAETYAQANGIPVPEGGLFISHGIAIPVLVAIAVGVIMTFVATRTRFGRYVFAMGGNPEAAELAGINTRWVTVKIFMLMGALVAIAASISSARLNASTNAMGTLDELFVIAAAVIGGTSLSGGVGTIVGAMIGALVMQSLQSGMVLMGLDSPLQSIVVGIVLVFAVWLDTLYRNRAQ